MSWWVCPTVGCRQALPMSHEVERPPTCGDCLAVKVPSRAPVLEPPPEAETKPAVKRRRR